MFAKRLGQILGLFLSVLILVSVFLPYMSIGKEVLTIASEALFDCNRTGAIVIMILSAVAFVAAFYCKGIIVGILGILIFMSNLFFYNSSDAMGLSSERVELVKSFIGEFQKPGNGFYVITFASLILFLAGVLINRGNKTEIDRKSGKE